MLAENERQPYVVGHKTEILEILEQIAFALRYPDPPPSEFVEGNVLSYNERTGAIRIEWADSPGLAFLENDAPAVKTVDALLEEFPRRRDGFVR